MTAHISGRDGAGTTYMSQNLICVDFMNRSLILGLIHAALDFDPSVISLDDTDEWMNLAVQGPLLCFSMYFPNSCAELWAPSFVCYFARLIISQQQMLFLFKCSSCLCVYTPSSWCFSFFCSPNTLIPCLLPHPPGFLTHIIYTIVSYQ